MTAMSPSKKTRPEQVRRSLTRDLELLAQARAKKYTMDNVVMESPELPLPRERDNGNR